MSISSTIPLLGMVSYTDRQHIVSCGGFYRVHKMELGKTLMEVPRWLIWMKTINKTAEFDVLASMLRFTSIRA